MTAIPAPESACHEIALADTGLRFLARPGETVLAAMERAGGRRPSGAGIPVGCRGGGCGVCRVAVLDGTFTTLRMSAAHVSEQDRANGVVLACRTLPTGPLSVRVIGKLARRALSNTQEQ